jgi:SulP family sulfate permease
VQPAPKQLPDNQVTLLLPYGSLFFAAARDFEEEAPTADETSGAAVVISLRGRENLGSTAIGVLERYAETLARHDGQLFLANVSEPVRAQLEKTGALETIGADHVLPAEDGIIDGLSTALATAEEWLDLAED